MAEKKRFLLRVDPHVYEAIERWAADEMRSVNGQIEFALREVLKRAGRLPAHSNRAADREQEPE
jgi:hypothetical protein